MFRKKIWLTVTNPPGGLIVDIPQGTQGVPIVFDLQDVEISAGAEARFWAEKPSGLTVYQPATISTHGKTITITPELQTFIEPGITKGIVQIIETDDTMYSFVILFRVAKNPAFNSGGTESTNYDAFIQGAPGPAGPAGETGPAGSPGRGIVSIEKTATVDLVDTYTITYTDGTTSTYEVTNGSGADVEDEIEDIRWSLDYTPIEMIEGKVINCNVSTIDYQNPTSRAGYSCAVVPCMEGDSFLVTAAGIGNYRSYAFCDANGGRKKYSASGVNLDHEVLIAPPYAAYLIINDGSGSTSYIGETVRTTRATVKGLASTKIGKTPGKNLFDPYSEGIAEGYYIGTDGGLVPSASYCVSDYIPLVKGKRYTISGCYTSSVMTVALYDSEFKLIDVVTGSPSMITATEGLAWMRVPVLQSKRYTEAQIEVGMSATAYEPYTDQHYVMQDLVAPVYDETASYSKGDVVVYGGLVYQAAADVSPETWTPSHWTRSTISSLVGSAAAIDPRTVMIGDNGVSAEGTNLAADTAVNVGIANVAKHVMYELCMTFDTFSSVKIGQGADATKYASWVTIDDTNITISANMGESTPRETVFAHGLTISEFLNVQIITDDSYKCTVAIQTAGGHYTSQLGTFFGICDGQAYFTSSTVTKTYKFRKLFMEAAKPVYLFGDSYMSFASNRWPYYLNDVEQFNEVLINACGGMNSERACHSLSSLKGCPKFALWALGMNDAADTDSSTPAANWMTGVQNFLAWCTDNHATPVFATIPTVPSKNNEGKNAWVRSSGYRYVDIAAAVGAQPDGTWYAGMVSADNIHPTVEGAIAMYHRVIADFPEIMTKL